MATKKRERVVRTGGLIVLFLWVSIFQFIGEIYSPLEGISQHATTFVLLIYLSLISKYKVFFNVLIIVTYFNIFDKIIYLVSNDERSILLFLSLPLIYAVWAISKASQRSIKIGP